MIEKARGNSKIIWNPVKKNEQDITIKKGNCVNLNVNVNVNGMLTNNPGEIAEALNHNFIDSVATTMHNVFHLNTQMFVQSIQWNRLSA